LVVVGVVSACALAGTAVPALAVTGYSADGAVNLRPTPDTSQAPLTQTYNGQPLDIICQAWGQNIGGSAVWDYTTVNGRTGFLSDYYVNGTPYAVLDWRIPPCGATRQWGAIAGGNTGLGGQCTYGAMIQFHNATGVYPAVYGNARDWDASARQNGWTVVLDAEQRSVVVFQPGVQGADPNYGHVAWVEDVEMRSDGRYVHVLEMNGSAGPWNWDRRVVKDVWGMSYILAP
jgi:CHAP domain.